MAQACAPRPAPPTPRRGRRANLTRRDAEEFLALAPRVPVETRVTSYPLKDAGEALADLRSGRFTGAAVLTP
jgi:propanol-preferring alcohol dehydrogenase